MKSSKMLKNLIYLVIMSTFLFDSYFKLSQLPREADHFRSKYQSLQDFVKRNSQGSFSLPYDISQITSYSTYIVSGFALLQALLAVFVILGQR